MKAEFEVDNKASGQTEFNWLLSVFFTNLEQIIHIVFIGNFEQVTLYYNIRGFNSKKPIYRSVSNCKQGSLKQSYFRWIFGSTETTKHCIVVTYRNQMSFERINSFIRKKPKEAKRMQDWYPPWINHSIKKLSKRKTFLHEVAKRDVLRETFKTHFA